MNLLVTHPNPIEAARYLDDRRVRRAIKDTSIFLSNAMYARQSAPNQLNISVSVLNQIDHPYQTNSPLSRWVRQSKGNYSWTFQYYHALLGVFNDCIKETLSETIRGQFDDHTKRIGIYGMYVSHMPDGSLLPFRNFARNRYYALHMDHLRDIHAAYKLYLYELWKVEQFKPWKPIWSNRPIPQEFQRFLNYAR